MASQTTVIATDGHAPHHSTPHCRSLARYLEATYVDHFVLAGDWWDCEEISRYVVGNPRLTEGKRIKDTAATARRVISKLVTAARAKNPKCEVYYIEGNHEARMHAVLDRNPVFEGLLSVPALLDLDAMGVHWAPFWSEGTILDLGPFCVIHGWSHAVYHTIADLRALNKPFFRGHTHDIQIISLPTVGGGDLTGHSCMCLCELRQGYLKGKPTRWKNGFMVVKHGPGWYQAQPVVMQSSGRFYGPDGKEYTP